MLLIDQFLRNSGLVMGTFEIIGYCAAVVTLIGATIRFKKWIFPSYMKSSNSGLPLWDVVIKYIAENNDPITVAYLTVIGENKYEARDRAGQLMKQWNEIRLGFSLPLDQPLPIDDENNPIKIVHPEFLPTADGQKVPIDVWLSKREFILIKWSKFIIHKLRIGQNK